VKEVTSRRLLDFSRLLLLAMVCSRLLKAVLESEPRFCCQMLPVEEAHAKLGEVCACCSLTYMPAIQEAVRICI